MCTSSGPLLIIVEYCEHGCLLNYLRENRQEVLDRGTFVTSLNQVTRVRFAYDVCKGMAYLETLKVSLHRIDANVF